MKHTKVLFPQAYVTLT